jgi:hypothetical protein
MSRGLLGGMLAISLMAISIARAQENKECMFLECTPPPAQPAPSPPPQANPSPAPTKGFVVYQSTDLRGDDLLWLTGADLVSCSDACRSNNSCVAFTLNTEKSVCILKQGLGQQVFFAGAVSGVMQSARTSPGSSRISLRNGFDFPGNDYGNVRGVSLDQCRATCSADARCNAFSYVKSKNWCWLKSAASSPLRNDDVESGTRN